MDESDQTPAGSTLWTVLAGFAATIVLAGLDLAADLREGTALGHALAEGAIMLVGLAGAAFVGRVLARRLGEARQLERSLAQSRAEAERFRSEVKDVMAGLARAIDQQFERWHLSAAEKEVGLLLLKGLSHKEIAQARAVTEATVRQQARAVYKKAGLSGRADLAGFFLEDLLLPPPA